MSMVSKLIHSMDLSSQRSQNSIYMPIRPYGSLYVDNITLRILDDDGDLVDFRGEKIIINFIIEAFVKVKSQKEIFL